MAQNSANPNPQQISDNQGNTINPAKEDGNLNLDRKLLEEILVELRDIKEQLIRIK